MDKKCSEDVSVLKTGKWNCPCDLDQFTNARLKVTRGGRKRAT